MTGTTARSTIRFAAAAALGLLALQATTACSPDVGADGSPDTTTGMAVSRSTLYTSVEDLSADSTLVVVGRVTDRTTSGSAEAAGADTVHTVSTFEVTEATPAAGREDADTDVPAAGSTIEVRQLGSTVVDQLPAPILEVGQDYLLFLTPTGLSGGAASQFHITGGTAGYYRSTAGPTGDRADAGATFGKVGDEGDTLPATLTADQIP